MLLGVLIVDEQLAVLAVPLWLIVRNADDGEDALALAEDAVHLLERAVGGFGIEEVDAGHDEGVDDGEDDVGLVTDGREGHGGDHNDHEVEDPVGGGGDGVGWGADAKRDLMGKISERLSFDWM